MARRGGAPKGFNCTCEKQFMYPPKPGGKYKKPFIRCSHLKCKRTSNAKSQENPSRFCNIISV